MVCNTRNLMVPMLGKSIAYWQLGYKITNFFQIIATLFSYPGKETNPGYIGLNHVSYCVSHRNFTQSQGNDPIGT